MCPKHYSYSNDRLGKRKGANDINFKLKSKYPYKKKEETIKSLIKIIK